MERTELSNGSTSDADCLASFDGFFLFRAFCLRHAVERGLDMAGFVGTVAEASRGGTEEVRHACVGVACIGEAWAINSLVAR